MVIYKPGSYRINEGCLEIVDRTPLSKETTIFGKPYGQSIGSRIIWLNKESSLFDEGLLVHERVHIIQAEQVNAIAHLVLVPLSLLLPLTYTVIAVLLAQSAFGISYGGHFLFEWAKLKFKKDLWKKAYMNIWAEVIAYRIQDEFIDGKRTECWGSSNNNIT